MTEPEKAIKKIKKLDIFARTSGAKIDVAALYAENMASGLVGKASQEMGVHAVGDSFMNELGKCYRGETRICDSCRMLNSFVGHPFDSNSPGDDPCRFSCAHVMPKPLSWPWLQIDAETKDRIGRFATVLMWLRFINAARAGEDVADEKWCNDLLAEFDDICRIACAAVETKIEKGIAKSENAEVPLSPLPPPPAVDGFRKSDRKMLTKVFRLVVLEENPDDAQRAGDVRHRQALYGARLYKPSSKYEKGVSFREAAKMTIKDKDGKFRDEDGNPLAGAYDKKQEKALAQAIRRVYNAEEGDSAT